MSWFRYFAGLPSHLQPRTPGTMLMPSEPSCFIDGAPAKLVVPDAYQQLGGAGVQRRLYECQRCGSAVSNKHLHDRRCKQ